MRKWLLVLIAGLSVAGAAFWAWPRAASAETQTVTGQVVCLACYARNPANTGLDHDRGRACAIACTKWRGNPVGLVTADGKVYQLAGGLTSASNAKITPHMARRVTITGDVSVRNGMTLLAADGVQPAK